ncbi:MAG: hypothetical protein L3J20_07220 [Flavobacteriaceae bacterium]|nr:hypothetical protein [Flavobacteriaceae bacterium]
MELFSNDVINWETVPKANFFSSGMNNGNNFIRSYEDSGGIVYLSVTRGERRISPLTVGITAVVF